MFLHSLTITITTITMFHSVLYTVVLTLLPLVWAAEPATNTSCPQSNIVLPAHLGPYPVSIYEHEVKTSRPDPLAPTAELRRLMITVYRPFLDNLTCPLEHHEHIPYAPSIVVNALLAGPLRLPLNISSSDPSSIFAPMQLLSCSRPIPSSSPSGPLLLFSHGYLGSRHFYASIIQAAASSGYTVVAIDHTYESPAVVFPDGYVAYTSEANNKYDDTVEGTNFLQSIRVADAVSVLDAIEHGDVPGLCSYSNSSSSCSSNLTSTFPSKPLRAVMYGHSFGGSTAANAAVSDDRIIAAANIDGIFYEPVANGTIRKPLLMMASAPQDTAIDWPTFYPAHARGWKTWVRPNDTVHYSYTDLPLLSDLLGLRGDVVPAELTGTMDGRRLQEIVWRYTMQFFDFMLKGVTPELLVESSAEFPDVEFVSHAEAETSR